MAQSGGNATRKGLQVVLNLSNGKTKVFKDEAAVLDGSLCGYRYVTNLVDAGFYVVDQKCEIDHTYRLVSVLDGKTKGTGSEYPKATTNGQKVFMMDTDREQLKNPLFQVWQLKGKGAVAWEAKIELQGFDGIDWPGNITSRQKDENTILIFYGPHDAPEQEAVAVASFNGKKWSVTNNKNVLAEIRAPFDHAAASTPSTHTPAKSTSLKLKKGEEEKTLVGRLASSGTMFGSIEGSNGSIDFERVPQFEDRIYEACSTDWDCRVHAIVDSYTGNMVKLISVEKVK